MFSGYLLLHQIRNHLVGTDGIPSVNKCKYCYKTLSTPERLTIHIQKKHTDPLKHQYLCDMCGKEFRHKQKLNLHYRVHTGNKPFTCGFCDKSFTKKDYLKAHERIHTGERPFACKFCEKRCNQKSALIIHERTHTGEKPFKCIYCNKDYPSKTNLKAHIKVCPGPNIDDDDDDDDQ